MFAGCACQPSLQVRTICIRIRHCHLRTLRLYTNPTPNSYYNERVSIYVRLLSTPSTMAQNVKLSLQEVASYARTVRSEAETHGCREQGTESNSQTDRAATGASCKETRYLSIPMRGISKCLINKPGRGSLHTLLGVPRRIDGASSRAPQSPALVDTHYKHAVTCSHGVACSSDLGQSHIHLRTSTTWRLDCKRRQPQETRLQR